MSALAAKDPPPDPARHRAPEDGQEDGQDVYADYDEFEVHQPLPSSAAQEQEQEQAEVGETLGEGPLDAAAIKRARAGSFASSRARRNTGESVVSTAGDPARQRSPSLSNSFAATRGRGRTFSSQRSGSTTSQIRHERSPSTSMGRRERRGSASSTTARFPVSPVVSPVVGTGALADVFEDDASFSSSSSNYYPDPYGIDARRRPSVLERVPVRMGTLSRTVSTTARRMSVVAGAAIDAVVDAGDTTVEERPPVKELRRPPTPPTPVGTPLEHVPPPPIVLPIRRSWLVRIGKFALSQWNLLTMGLLILLAYLFPYVGTTGGAIRAEYTVGWGAVALIFLIAGLSLSIGALRRGIPHWRAHLVSNGFSFLLVPALMFGWATAGRTAGLDFWVMAGIVLTGCLPTTIASNVTCTLNAGGSTELASIEVVIGNVIGTFITPLLAKMFLTDKAWAGSSPGASSGGGGNDGITKIYIRMAEQLSATLFAPLIVGLIIQHYFPRPVAKVRTKLHLGKVASLMTTLCVWQNFCKAFYSGAFKTASGASIIYLCFMNLATYLLLSVMMWALVRLPGVQARWARNWRFTKKDTIALCFCGPAKGVAVGAPLIAILYADSPVSQQAKLALALLVYNGEQVACAQLVVPLLKRWAADERVADLEMAQEKVRVKEEESTGSVGESTPGEAPEGVVQSLDDKAGMEEKSVEHDKGAAV